MTASSLRYLIKEGLRNTWTNRMMSFASICVLLSCLVLIGSATMMFLNVNSLIERNYFHWYLLSNVGRIEIDLRTSTAAGQFTISGEGLRDIGILLPPIEEQRQISEYLNRRIADIDTLTHQKENVIVQLESYKKSLIFEYVTGKKEVPVWMTKE